MTMGLWLCRYFWHNNDNYIICMGGCMPGARRGGGMGSRRGGGMGARREGAWAPSNNFCREGKAQKSPS